MDDPNRHIKDLEQELLDERSQRQAAEKRSAELSERVDTWRTRAEERAERIDRLDAEKPGPFLGWLRPKTKTPREGSIASVAAATEQQQGAFPTPGLRSLRVAALVSHPGLAAALDVMDRRTIVDRGSIDDADLVVYDPIAFEATEDKDGLRALLSREPGPPVLRWELDTSGSSAANMPGNPISFPPSFDARIHNPAVRWRVDEPSFVADSQRVQYPDDALIEHAAAGGVIVPVRETGLDDMQRSAASAAARRWAYRNHSPWIRARQLTETAGIGTYDPLPSVAGVLVSNRPEMLPAALENMARQTYRRLLFVVGLHGEGDPGAIAEIATRLGIERRTQILQVSASETLGAALNRCIDRANADVIAKIDDDDYYGPSYIEDAVHALAYSGAGMVGKATQFTYFADRDLTVLRRPGTEETFVDGTATGASLVFRRVVWEATRFPHRPRQVDVHFERGARLAGATLYVGNRWEFRYFRGHDGHTWAAEDDTLLAGTDPAFSGVDPAPTNACRWPLDVG